MCVRVALRGVKVVRPRLRLGCGHNPVAPASLPAASGLRFGRSTLTPLGVGGVATEEAGPRRGPSGGGRA